MGTAGIAGQDGSRRWGGASNSVAGKKKPAASVRVPEWQESAHLPPSDASKATRLESFLPGPAEIIQRWPLLVHIATDIAVAFVTIGGVVFWSHRFTNSLEASLRFSLSTAFLYGVLFTLLCHSEGLYDSLSAPCTNTRRLLKASCWSTIIIGFVASLPGSSPQMDWRVFCAAALVQLGGAMMVWRIRDWWTIRQAHRGVDVRNVLILGTNRTAVALANKIESNLRLRRVFRGFLDDGPPLDPRVVGSIDDLPRLVHSQFADELIVAMPLEHPSVRRALIKAAGLSIQVKVAPDLPRSLGCQPRLQTWGSIPILCIQEYAIPLFGLFLKRILDVIIASLSLLFLSPVLMCIAVWVRLDSSGPAIYRSMRLGKKGRRFECYKFRTMAHDADAKKNMLRLSNERSGAFFKIKKDPRITRAGKWLRRYSLDELPQLWNVLKGDMSLVGPRPHPLDDCERYSTEHLQRLTITPGLTGLWQVTARQDPSFEHSMSLDLEYIRRWSLWFDFQILARTLFVVAAGSGV